MALDRDNPCLSCGACCAYFRASFYWRECDDSTPGGVPAELTEPHQGLRRAMKGTLAFPPRCTALEGEIGAEVRCGIYDRRSSVCRAFVPSFEAGKRNPRCDRARKAHGLRPLTAADWPAPARVPPRSPRRHPGRRPRRAA